MVGVATIAMRVWVLAIGVIGALALTAFAVRIADGRPSGDQAQRPAETVLGTWTGTSVCVGHRPACKDEEVVYRFRAVENQPQRVTLLADKVIDGKRVPMYKLEFTFTGVGSTLSCEFTRGQTHGIWEYKVSGEMMAGTLVILPDRTLGRRVNVHRVSEDEMPKAPALDEYGSLDPAHHAWPVRAELAVAPEATRTDAHPPSNRCAALVNLAASFLSPVESCDAIRT